MTIMIMKDLILGAVIVIFMCCVILTTGRKIIITHLECIHGQDCTSTTS